MWYESQLFAAMLGALAAFIAAALPIAWSLHYDRFKGRLEEHEFHYDWLQALLPELSVMASVIDEALRHYKELQENKSWISPKRRLKLSFFREARSALKRHPRAVVLNPAFSQTAANLDLAEDMMHRFDERYAFILSPNYKEVAHGKPPEFLKPILPGAIVALEEAKASISSFIALANEQLSYEPADRPRLFGSLTRA